MKEFEKALLLPNPMTPNRAVIFYEDKCIGCKPPIVLYPDECWFAGCCVGACPVEGACEMAPPLQQRVAWVRKDTGEFFRVGMKNPPPVTYTKPPVI